MVGTFLYQKIYPIFYFYQLPKMKNVNIHFRSIQPLRILSKLALLGMMACMCLSGLQAQVDPDNVTPAQTAQMQRVLKMKRAYTGEAPSSNLMSQVSCSVAPGANGKKVITLNLPTNATATCLERFKMLETEWEMVCNPMPTVGANTISIEVDANVAGYEFYKALAERGIIILKTDIPGI